MLNELISLIYPHVCLSCTFPLRKYEKFICLKCKNHLPKTQFAERVENPVMKLMWGKAMVEHASSSYYFKKGNRIQKLMHQLKYKGKEELGEELGKMMALELKKSSIYEKIDGIIPLPLHLSKKRLRGYNQCDSLAIGIAENLKIEIFPTAIMRIKANISQTKKGYFERHENVNDIFKVCEPEKLNGKNILLIDDVITTGSTLAACAKTLNDHTSARLFISTLAVAI